MKTLLLFLVFMAVTALPAQTARTVFADAFKTSPDGSVGGPGWHVVKGNWHIRDGQYEQTSAEYDCASMLDAYMDSSFEFEATFEQLSGDPGVGFIFAARRYDETAFAQMARFDGGTTFLAGYFQNGEFTGTASTKAALLVPGARHTLLLRVMRETGSWSIRLDGAPIFEREIPLHYRGGYVGLQSSAGSVRFSAATLRTLHSSDPYAVGWKGHDWIGHFAVAPPPPSAPAGALLIPDARRGLVLAAGPNSFLSDRTVIPIAPTGLLVEPTAVAYVDAARIAVTDRGTSQIHLFDSRTYAWIASAGWKGNSPGTLDDPCAVAADGHRRLFVVERKNNRVQVFDDSLRSIATFGTDRLKGPADIALQGDSIFVLNAGLSQIECYRWDGAKARWFGAISYGGGDGRCLGVRRDTLYLSVVNQVRAYALDGSLLRTFDGRSIGYIYPQGIGFDPAGRVCIGDYVGSRVIWTDANLTDPLPSVRFTSGDSPTAEIALPRDAHSVLVRDVRLIGKDSTAWKGDGGRDTLRFTFGPLRPSTTYHFQTNNALLTEPSDGAIGNFSFTTPGAPGTKQYARLKMAAVIFTDVVDEKAPHPAGTEPAAVPAAEVERITAQIRDGVRFYWMQTGMRLFLDVDVVVVPDSYKRSEVYGSEWWYPPKESLLASVLVKAGRSVGDYSSFLYLPCVQAYDTTLHKFVLAGKGGGFTNGVGTGKGYGISWWDVTRKDHNAGNNWLMVHEFNHQLDDIFMVSGYPEYWFNHISPTIGTAAAFGEHFDANAYILRMVPDEEWTDLRYTALASARDADGDGIPDNAPALPSDEVRLHSDSTKRDTDGDGLSDLAELRNANWITEGWGETYGGAKLFPDLAKSDTDGDGVPDAADPYPLYPAKPEIRLLAPGEKPGAAERLGTLDDPLVRAGFSAWWSDSALTVRFDLDKRRNVKLMVDAGGDGWFLGRGNYLLLASPAEGGRVTISSQIFNATNPAEWPFMDKTLSDTLGVTAAASEGAGGRSTVTVRIPRNQFLGLGLRAGDTVGLLLGVQCPFGTEGMKRYVDLWEPNRFMNFRLVP
jgi:hypothetical protein